MATVESVGEVPACVRRCRHSGDKIFDGFYIRRCGESRSDYLLYNSVMEVDTWAKLHLIYNLVQHRDENIDIQHACQRLQKEDPFLFGRAPILNVVTIGYLQCDP